jgi:hypothetical protein
MASSLLSRKSDPNNTRRSGSLLRKLVILLLIISLTVIVLMIQKYANTRQNISTAVIKQLTNESELKLQSFFRPITTNASIIKRWALNGDIDFSKPGELTNRFIPVLEQSPQIHSIAFATEDGLDYMLMRDSDGWRSRTNQKFANGTRQAAWQRLDPTGNTIGEEVGKLSVDHRNKPWFQGALTDPDDEIFWTEPYELFPTSNSGVSAAVSWKRKDRYSVAAINVLMSDFRELVNSIRIGDSFQIFLFSETLVFIDFLRVHRRTMTADDTGDDMAGSDTIGETVISRALTVWEKQMGIEDPFPFEHGGDRWWGLLRSIEESKNAGGIGILVQEKDLVARQKNEKYLFVPIALAVFWVAFLFFVRIYTRESKDVAGHIGLSSIEGEDIRKIIEAGESDRLEFKSTLRWNLKSGKAGKEIELASLKTIAAFLNSDGGTLLVGVGDNGELHGVEPDGFDNDDKYLRHFSSLFNQHIGLEFSEYIEFDLKEIGDTKIFMVNCSRSQQPVFLKHKKDEQFYIRSGPSSRQLTTSQVIEYLKEK